MSRRLAVRLALGLLVLAAPAGAFHTVFDYRVERFAADGNAFGPADGVADLVDEFDDGTLTPDWGNVAGTAREENGLLHLTNPGTHYDVGVPIDVSEVIHATRVIKDQGDFTLTSTWASVPVPGDFIHMTLFITGGSLPTWEFFGVLFQNAGDGTLFLTQHHGTGFSASTVEWVPIDPAAITGPVALRIVFEDASDLATIAFSLDGGATFTSPLPATHIFEGRTSAGVLLGADPQQATTTTPGGPPVCGNARTEDGEQCDLGVRRNGEGCCTAACTLVDADGDGVCDPRDSCPRSADAGQADADGDGLGDACDGCATPTADQRRWHRALVAVLRVNDGRPGNEGLRVRGRFALAPGSPPVDPRQTGARVQVRSLHGEPPIDLVVPAGEVDAEGVGWREATPGRFVFLDPSGLRAGGIRWMIVRNLAGGRVAASALAPRASLDFGASALPPLQAAISLGDTRDACGEVAFTLRRCASPGGQRIVCR